MSERLFGSESETTRKFECSAAGDWTSNATSDCAGAESVTVGVSAVDEAGFVEMSD